MKKYNKTLVAAFILCIIAHCSLFIDNCRAQWVLQTIPQDIGIILSIDFTDFNNGISCGWGGNFQGKALYTTNGGTNWLPSSVPDSSRSFVSAKMINAQTGYLAGAYNLSVENRLCSSSLSKSSSVSNADVSTFQARIGMTYNDDYKAFFAKTTNGGQSWFAHGSLPPQFTYLEGMDFADVNTGYVIGNIQVGVSNVLKTTNGGLSWSVLLDSNSTHSLGDIRLLNANTIATIETNKFLKSTDSGNSWSITNLERIYKFCFTTLNIGFAAIQGPESQRMIYKSADGGNSWNIIRTMDEVSVEGIRFYPGSGTGMIYGERWVGSSTVPFASRTTDYGISWTDQEITDTSQSPILFGGILLSSDNQYITGGRPFGGYGSIYHTTNGGLMSATHTDTKIPDRYSLSQNFPNPFNPITNLEFGISDLGFVSLKVYDILGKEVVTLVKEKLSAGKYIVEFDGSGLTSGVYFYRLTAGEFTETKRMMLVK